MNDKLIGRVSHASFLNRVSTVLHDSQEMTFCQDVKISLFSILNYGSVCLVTPFHVLSQ